MSSLALLRRASPLVRLLVLSQLAFNAGFYLVLPFLAVHLARDLVLAAGTVALVLGLRTASQQGLFVVGGALADRFGPRPLVLTGCAARVVGFVLLGSATSVPGVVAGALLTGVAAALFSPAVESELARAATRDEAAGGLERRRAFGLFSVAGEVGAFAGPVLGSLLLLVAGFAVTSWVAAALFVALLVAHARLLPRSAPAARRPAPAGRLGSVGEVLADHLFVVVALAHAGYLVVYNQLYLALPLELERASVPQSAADLVVGVLFAASACLVVVAQLPLLGWAERRLQPVTALVVGFVLLAAGVLAAAASRQVGGPVAALVGAALLVALVTVGQMLVLPVGRDLVAAMSGGRHLGTRYGIVSTCGGLAVLVGSWGVGALVDAVAPGGPGRALPWLVLSAVPVASAVVLVVVRRRVSQRVLGRARADAETASTESATSDSAGAATAQGARST